MSSSNNNNNNNTPARVSSRKGKNLHVAHRRSPSELTNLMVEQYNLQRQLEQVQAQQKLLEEQQKQQQQQFVYPPPQQGQGELLPPPSSPGFGGNNRGSHSRSSSINSHRRTGSGGANTAHGHSRRHSLGLNEAIKAAANQRQNNRTSTLSPSVPNESKIDSNDAIGSFKFPPSSNSDDAPASPEPTSHNRSRSLAYGQQPFKFPPTPDQSNESRGNSLLPPNPNFTVTQSPDRGHNRRSSHFRSRSRGGGSNAEGMNLNWRAQQQSPQQQQQNHNRQSSTLEPPQAGFVPGHKPRNSSYGGGSSVSSLLHFLPSNGGSQISSHQQGGGAGGPNIGLNSNNGRKTLFAPYLPQSSLPELINEGRLVTGTLRVNKKNRSDAYVSTDGLLDADIFICGSKDRNRALEGDLVAVELLIVDEVWESKKEKEEKREEKTTH